MTRPLTARLGAALALVVWAGAAPAQMPPAPPPTNLTPDPAQGIRVLNQDRLLRDSRLGQALLADLRAAEAALGAENQALFDQLAAEERALTDLRASLPADEFRARAQAFDARVEAIRAERAALSQDLARRYEAETQRFFLTARGVLDDLMADQGIVALLSPQAVILGPDWLDITDAAIDRLDQATAP